jgi:hypothetical protein
MEAAFTGNILKTQSLTLPVRATPLWQTTEVTHLTCRETFLKLVSGKIPIGILPDEILSEDERLRIVEQLENLPPFKKYENTSTEQKVEVYGFPFVDAATMKEYLAAPEDSTFAAITSPLMDRVLKQFRNWGFSPTPLIDSLTLKPYKSKVCRYIQIPKGCITETGEGCTVLHVDDIIRDGMKKKDFRFPLGLEGKEYYQISVNILLENGGFLPDKLFVYEKQYSVEMESEFLDNKWQYPLQKVEPNRCLSHTPLLRECYMFSTQNFHDVREGDNGSKRLTFSVFFVYVPETNEFFYYN